MSISSAVDFPNPGIKLGSPALQVDSLSTELSGNLVAQLVKNPPTMWEIWVRSMGWEDPLEKGKTTHTSILAQRIPWTVQSMGSQRVGHD